MPAGKPQRILVTGATGYIGGRLAPRLLAEGYAVRCLVRDPARLQGRPWAKRVEIVRGDLLTSEGLAEALRGVDAAYYLVHSMGSGRGFPERDRDAAGRFARAAAAAGLPRVIYLGGLGDAATRLSPHLRSRHETGEVLRRAGLSVTEFRSAVIVGAGSISFEMVRYLTERLPVMPSPPWTKTHVQPIWIRTALDYLVAALTTPDSAGQLIEIGGAEVLTYREMVRRYARVRGLPRVILPIPFLPPIFCYYLVHFLTPIHAHTARHLIASLRSEVICRTDLARRLFPSIEPIDYASAVADTLSRITAGEVETVWSDALASTPSGRRPTKLRDREGVFVERRAGPVRAAPEQVYETVSGIGGSRGWPYWNWMWRLRGSVDRLVGGVGMRRGRKHPEHLHPGDVLDVWRVEAAEPGRLLRLRAEMRMPGRAWLEFQIHPQEDGGAYLVQDLLFAPKGLGGLLYWYLPYPLHRIVFNGLFRRLVQRARNASRRPQAVRRDAKADD